MTTIEEAIAEMETRKQATIAHCASCWTESAEMSLQALKKQIPMDVVLEGDGYADGEIVYDEMYCPSCGAYFERDYVPRSYKYCPYCGQKWSDSWKE